MFKLYDLVTIRHPLFEGSSGTIVGFANQGAELLFIVEFTDRDDHVDKKVYFKQDEITPKK